jgi:hypothetical protein
LYQQNSLKSKFKAENKLSGVFKGEGFLQDGEVVKAPMDFRFKNRISLLDLEGILMRLIYPQLFSIDQQFTLNDKDLEFLRFWMSRSTLEVRLLIMTMGIIGIAMVNSLFMEIKRER